MLVLLGAVGTLVAWRRPTRLPATLVVAAGTIYTGGYVLTWVNVRYLWTTVLLLAALGGVALSALRRPAHRLTTVGLAAVLLVASVVPALSGAVERWGSGADLRAVADRLREDLVDGGVTHYLVWRSDADPADTDPADTDPADADPADTDPGATDPALPTPTPTPSTLDDVLIYDLRG